MSDAMSVMIVEDEWITSEGIKEVLEKHRLNVSGQFDNAKEALDFAKDHVVDVAILDIEIKGDKDGIWLAEQLNEIRSTAIIFLTAYDDEAHLNRAKEVVPAAYLIKPFQSKNLLLTIEVAFSNLLKERDGEEVFPEHFRLNDRIFIKEGNLLVKVLIDDIQYIEAVGSYCKIYTSKGQYTLALNLKTFQSKFESSFFVRVHRSYMVNAKHIDAINGNLIYIGNSSVPIGASQRSEVIKRLQVI